MKYFEDSGPYWSPDRYVYAQKYDSDGNEVWDEVTTIVDEGGITAWNQVFSMVKDDQNGFYIAWHEDRYGTMDAHVFAQHIGSDGSILFQEDGVELAISSNRERYSPKIIWHEASEDIFVYWTEMDSDQNSAGIYGQRLNSVGEVLWGDNGIQIEPLQQPRFTLADAVAGADGALLFADIEASNNILKACLLDDQGAFVWTDGFKDLSTAATSKTHAVMCEESMDQWVMCWGSDDGTIMAQNISVNGELGPVEQISGISGLISLNGGGGSLAEVIVSAGETSTNVEASGTYFLQLDPGVYTVTAQLEDYETAEQTVTVVEGIVEEGIDFSLDPAYYPPANVSIDSDAGSLYWDDPQLVRDITGYQVYLDESSVGQIDAEITEFSFIGLINGTEYTAGVAAMYGDYLSEIVTVDFTYEGTGSEDFIPSITTLHGNYPNPFNPSTDIRFSLGRDTEVLLDVYNIKGEKVRTLVDGHLQVNDYSIQWNGKDDSGDIVGSGVYFYKLKTEKYTSTRKMILMK